MSFWFSLSPSPKMKYSLAVSGLFALASAATLAPTSSSPKKSYAGYKVVRLSVGPDVAAVQGMVDRLGLATWMGAPRANAKTDIVVPPERVSAFEAETAGMDSLLMHDDLGASMSTLR